MILERIKRAKLVTNTVNDVSYKFIHPIDNHAEIKNLNWEPKLAQILYKNFKELKKDYIFWDIGAAFGVFSILSKKCNPSSTVISIEPYWVRRWILKINTLFTNKLNVKNLFVSNIDSNKQIRLSTLSERLNHIPDIMKMDIEGGEYEAILGSIEWLKVNKPIIIFEFHKGIMERQNKNHDLIIKKLEEIGYILELVDHHDDELSNNFLYYCKCI
ncbi:FkbM family methyltransferase [Flavobacteriaceae bacterium]|nr:FkbM family methyltransferase [Flavobacteriaceae bacterium]